MVCNSPMPSLDADGPSGVNALPSEVLLEIFQALKAPAGLKKPGSTARWDQRQMSATWLVVNLVCRRWHTVASTSPILWRTIDVGRSVKWLQLCLARSGATPLDVLLYDRTTVVRAAGLLLEHAGRLRSLRVVRDVAADLLYAVSRLFRAGMPALEELYLDADKRGAPYEGKCLLDVFRLGRKSESLFPSLRVLHLSALYLPPKASLLQNLRVLELIESRPEGPRPKMRLTMDEFLDALEACYLTLEHLKLWNSFPFCLCEDCGGLGRPHRAIALPKLRTLSLLCPPDAEIVTTAHGETTKVRHFLSYLRLPKRMETFVGSAKFHGERKTFHHHLPADPAVLPVLNMARRAKLQGAWQFTAYTPCACELQNMDDAHVRLMLEDAHASDEEEDRTSKVAPGPHSKDDRCAGVLTVDIMTMEGYLLDVAQEDAAAQEFGELFAHAPLRQLEVQYGPSAAGFGHLFGALRGLTVLQLECGAEAPREQVTDFLTALAEPYALGHQGEEGKGKGKEKEKAVDVPLPNLGALCLHNVCWYGGFAQDLEICVRSRVERGARQLSALHVTLFSARGVKRRKLNKKREQQLRALTELAETIEVDFSIVDDGY